MDDRAAPGGSRLVERVGEELRARVGRVRPTLWPVTQTAVATGLAWWLAQDLLGHNRPIFASITAIVAMGFAAGRRGRQVVAIVLGTALGIGLADLLLSVLGPGALQVGLVVFLAMVVGLLLSPEPLFVTQVAISAMLLVAVERQAGLTPDRLEDAVVGGTIALVLSVVVFPAHPGRLVEDAGRPVFDELVETLAECALALRTGDAVLARHARERSADVAELTAAVDLALDVTRIAPLRRRDAPRVRRVAAAAAEVPALARGVRVSAGSALRLLREDVTPQPALAEPLDELAASLRATWRWLETGDVAVRETARRHAQEAARRAASSESGRGLAEGTLLHLSQALARRVLLATGVDGRQAGLLAGLPPGAEREASPGS